MRDGAIPTSLEALRRHRTAHAGAHESRRVWLFHSHTYFDHKSPEQVAEAWAFWAEATASGREPRGRARHGSVSQALERAIAAELSWPALRR